MECQYGIWKVYVDESGIGTDNILTIIFEFTGGGGTQK